MSYARRKKFTYGGVTNILSGTLQVVDRRLKKFHEELKRFLPFCSFHQLIHAIGGSSQRHEGEWERWPPLAGLQEAL